MKTDVRAITGLVLLVVGAFYFGSGALHIVNQLVPEGFSGSGVSTSIGGGFIELLLGAGLIFIGRELRKEDGLLRPQTHSSSFEEIRERVEALFGHDYSSLEARKADDQDVVSVLRQLEAAVDRVKEQAGDYPTKPMPSQVWLDGTGYADLCRRLHRHFHTAGWLAREENASALWVRATLAVHSHYRHLVGPAMIAGADCQERLGNISRAAQMYQAVVADFKILVDDETDGSVANEDDRIALGALEKAADRLIKIGIGTDDINELEKIRSRAARIAA